MALVPADYVNEIALSTAIDIHKTRSGSQLFTDRILETALKISKFLRNEDWREEKQDG